MALYGGALSEKLGDPFPRLFTRPTRFHRREDAHVPGALMSTCPCRVARGVQIPLLLLAIGSETAAPLS